MLEAIMDLYRNRSAEFERRSARQKFGVALLASSLLISAACSEKSESETTPSTTLAPAIPTIAPPATELTIITTGTVTTTSSEMPTETMEVAAEDCSFRYVQPGEHFNPENTGQLAEDLALVEKLHTEGTSVELGDIGMAAGIVRRSYQDPLYAEAFVKAIDAAQEQEFLSTEEFLSMEVSAISLCDNNHLEKDDSRAQLQQTVAVGQKFSRRIGERVGDQTSAAIKRAFELFEESMQELIEELNETQ